MADSTFPTPDDKIVATNDHPGSDADPDSDSDSDQDQTPPPDVSESDRFAIKGRELSLTDFIDATMDTVEEREPAEPAPQPVPQEWDIIWAARRPL